MSYLLILIITFFTYAESPGDVLIELSKTKPGNGEVFILKSKGDREEFFMSSNRFLSTNEFGWYSRPSTNIKNQLLAVVRSQDRIKSNRQIHDWKLKVLGKNVTPENGRFKDVLDIVEQIAKNPKLSPVAVTKVTMGAVISIKKTVEGEIKETKGHFFEFCTREYEQKPICEIDNGFIFIKN